jgi:acyl transferase domain-containing protein
MVPDPQDVAVIGMACRCPGAADLERFWENLAAGVESITVLSEDDLRAAGVDRARWAHPGYVRAAALLDGYDTFDARFFGYSPREAALLDPQQRVFLECAWTAVEHAGYDSGSYDGSIGVFAGAAMNTYLLSTGVAHLLRDDYVLAVTASDKDFLTSRVSYKLDLTGPSVAVQTACSTSLVAVHLACQSLLSGECDMALAGGVAVRVPQRAGYRYEPDGPLSPDGHCRAFDAQARGTLLGSGVGVVLLKPLADALADRDQVYAVIKGSAVNNDGSTKVNYEAPSVVGHAEVVAEALAHAGISADTVSYLEAHGTGTALGDPVEITALTRAFDRTTRRRGFCAIGSVKTNVGHLDAAAGVIGLIKAVLALRHGVIPPSLHFERPNPRIDFPRTPFYVNTAPTAWPEGGQPRRAGVSSLGIGGTNAHVVVEEAPPAPVSGPGRPYQLLVLSARTPTALDTATRNLAGWLAGNPAADLADVAYTLQVGRKAFGHRQAVVCRDLADAVTALDQPARRARGSGAEVRTRPVVFLFPGGGSRQPPVISDMYLAEPVFRDRIDHGLAELRSLAEVDLGRLLLPGGDARSGGGLPVAAYARPSVQLPVTFLIEEALAALWMSWGVRPAALLGHSMGELTAAHLAGVLTFSDALALVVARAELVEHAPRGGMLSIGLPAEEVVPLLAGDLDLAAVNAPDTCVVSGAVGPIEALSERLAGRGVEAVRVPVDAAGHSRLLDPTLGAFERRVAGCDLTPPSIPFLSNVTGTWVTDREATDPAYWARQLRSTVRFSDGVRELLSHPDRLFLEVGPGQTLSTLVRQHPDGAPGRLVIPSLRTSSTPGSGVASLLDALGRLWLAGAAVDWAGFTGAERRHRTALPTYPFERQRYWFEEVAEPTPRRRDRLRDRLGTAARRLAAAGGTARRRRGPAAPPAPPAPPQPAAADPYVAPRTPVERAVAEIWQEALGVPRVSIHDDFFELGGSSLLVTQVIARVNRAYDLELSLLTLVESPTVAGLAACVEAVGVQQPTPTARSPR